MWVKRRHKVITTLLRPVFRLYLKIKYRATFSKKVSMPEGSIIISNHTTTLDPFMVGMLFKQNLYYMASKDLFNHRFTGKVIKFLVNPIPKEKSKKSDFTAIKNCLKVAKENGNICIFPEGNRTLSGKLGYIDPSIVKLIKAIKKPLVIVNIEGGYPTDPRWGLTIRRGKLSVSVKEIYQYADIENMDNDELHQLIVDKLTVDDYTECHYKGKNLAEHLEKVFYMCPTCGKMHSIYTKKDKIYCLECGLEVTHLPSLKFVANKEEFKFVNVFEWYDWQVEELKKQTFVDDEVIYQDDLGLYLSIPNQSKELIGEGIFKMYNNRFDFSYENEVVSINFDDVTAVTLVGKKKMNIYVGDKTYQVFNSPKTNLLKYMHTYYVIKNIGGNYEFLGL